MVVNPAETLLGWGNHPLSFSWTKDWWVLSRNQLASAKTGQKCLRPCHSRNLGRRLYKARDAAGSMSTRFFYFMTAGLWGNPGLSRKKGLGSSWPKEYQT